MMDWIARIGGAVSRLLNVLLLNGSPDESISGRAHRENWEIEIWIDRIFFWQKHHCMDAYLWDIDRARWLLEQHR